MAKVVIDPKVAGPFFNLRGKELQKANREWVDSMTKEGEAKVESLLTPGQGVDTGAYKESITAKVKGHKFGLVGAGDDFNMVIRGMWLEGKSARNDQTRFKGYKIWRKSRSHVRKITKQIGGKVYKRAVQRLT